MKNALSPALVLSQALVRVHSSTSASECARYLPKILVSITGILSDWLAMQTDKHANGLASRRGADHVPANTLAPVK